MSAGGGDIERVAGIELPGRVGGGQRGQNRGRSVVVDRHHRPARAARGLRAQNHGHLPNGQGAPRRPLADVDGAG